MAIKSYESNKITNKTYKTIEGKNWEIALVIDTHSLNKVESILKLIDSCSCEDYMCKLETLLKDNNIFFEMYPYLEKDYTLYIDNSNTVFKEFDCNHNCYSKFGFGGYYVGEDYHFPKSNGKVTLLKKGKAINVKGLIDAWTEAQNEVSNNVSISI